jgi:acetyl esterase
VTTTTRCSASYDTSRGSTASREERLLKYAIDPDFHEVLPLLPTTATEDIADARATLAAVVPMLNADLDEHGLVIEDLEIPGPVGAPAVAVRTYRPTGGGVGGALLYIHGGGFTVGSIDSEHALAVEITREVDVVVVSVGYRLAPEDPFPAGLDDCYAALTWLHREAAAFGVDASRIGVIGQSAGGGLAAGLALLARDRGGPALCFQYLGIPELDHRLETTSMRTFVDTPLFNLPSAELSWRLYLGDEPAEVSPYASPSLATDFTGLPPAYISTMEFDPLRDEGINYASALLAAGVSCELHSFPGAFHGSALVATADASRRAKEEMMAVLSRRLGAHAQSSD